MKIKDIPKEGRPRERFLKHGPEALSDAELFAILLRTGIKNENVVDMSNRLIKEYGLDKLFDCSLIELQKIKGIGPGKAMQILTMNEILKRISRAKQPTTFLSSAKKVFELMRDKFKDEKQEHFVTLLLNNRNYFIKEELITTGVLDSSIVDTREIFKPAIKNSAARIILVHNHPSGNPSPSEEDIQVTKKIIEAGEMLGIRVLDHVIIGKDSYWSWREKKD